MSLRSFCLHMSASPARPQTSPFLALPVYWLTLVNVDDPGQMIKTNEITEYAIMYAFTPESFPAPHRGTGSGTAAALLRLGGLIASLISSQTGFTSAPIYASAALWVAVGVFCLGLPFETHGHDAL